MNKLLTIYTPTFNRSQLLCRVYASLKKQKNKNFIWMIIDDGSTDDTFDMVKKWQQEKIIEIIYYYKKNGGVHTARDFAYSKCTTELIMSVDSDDQLNENAIEHIYEEWNNNRNLNIIGIISPCININGVLLNNHYPQEKLLTYQELTYKYKYSADKVTILKTNVVKKLNKYPVFDNEKLVGEGYKWIQLPDIPFLIIDYPLIIVEYQDDGYSNNKKYYNLLKNTKGFRLNYLEHINSCNYFLPKIKFYIGYIACSYLTREKNYLKKCPNKLLAILLIPLGFSFYLHLSKLSFE